MCQRKLLDLVEDMKVAIIIQQLLHILETNWLVYGIN